MAYKQYLKSRIDDVEYDQIRREIEIHAGLSHRNVLVLYAAFEDKDAVSKSDSFKLSHQAAEIVTSFKSLLHSIFAT